MPVPVAAVPALARYPISRGSRVVTAVTDVGRRSPAHA